MTYRYVQLALYPKFKCEELIAYTRNGILIDHLDGFQELVLWSRQITRYDIDGATMSVILDFDFDEFDNY